MGEIPTCTNQSGTKIPKNHRPLSVLRSHRDWRPFWITRIETEE